MTPFSLIVEQVKTAGASLAKESARMLAFVAKLEDPSVLRECRAQADAVLAYLSHRKDLSVEEHNAAVKIRAKVEHRLGEVLAATVRRNRYDRASHLPDGIEPKQSSRAQALARIPWHEIETRIDAKTANNERAAQGHIVGQILAGRAQPQQRVASYPHSMRLEKWLRSVMSEPELIKQEFGSLAAMLEDERGWDRQASREYILPMLEALERTIRGFRKEIQRHEWSR